MYLRAFEALNPSLTHELLTAAIIAALALAVTPPSLITSADSGNALIKLWEKQVNGWVVALSWNHNNGSLALGYWLPGSKSNSSLMVLNEGGKAVWIKRFDARVTSLSWSPDGKLLAVGTIKWLGESELLVYDLKGGLLLNKSLEKYAVSSISWSPDSRELALLLVYPSWSGVVAFNLEGTRLWSVGVSAPVYSSISWRPEGDLIAVGNRLGSVTIINAEGRIVREVKGLGAYVTGVSWSPSGDELAVGANNSLIFLNPEGVKLSVKELATASPIPYWSSSGPIIVSVRNNRLGLTDLSTNKTYVEVLDTKVKSISWYFKNMELAVGGEYEVLVLKLVKPSTESVWVLMVVASAVILCASAALFLARKLRV